MPLATTPFDAAKYLTDPAQQADLLRDALRSRDAFYLANAARAVASAIELGAKPREHDPDARAREIAKAERDALLFGVGFLMAAHGDLKRIPPEDVQVRTPEASGDPAPGLQGPEPTRFPPERVSLPVTWDYDAHATTLSVSLPGQQGTVQLGSIRTTPQGTYEVWTPRDLVGPAATPDTLAAAQRALWAVLEDSST